MASLKALCSLVGQSSRALPSASSSAAATSLESLLLLLLLVQLLIAVTGTSWPRVKAHQDELLLIAAAFVFFFVRHPPPCGFLPLDRVFPQLLRIHIFLVHSLVSRGEARVLARKGDNGQEWTSNNHQTWTISTLGASSRPILLHSGRAFISIASNITR